MYNNKDEMNRDRIVCLRVSAAEYERWIKPARSRDMSLSAWIRRCVNALISGAVVVPEVLELDDETEDIQ